MTYFLMYDNKIVHFFYCLFAFFYPKFCRNFAEEKHLTCAIGNHGVIGIVLKIKYYIDENLQTITDFMPVGRTVSYCYACPENVQDRPVGAVDCGS